jgi:hypothetical protein
VRQRSGSNGTQEQGEIAAVKAAIYSAAKAEQPLSIRRIFYALVSQGVVRKTEVEYRSTVGRLSRQISHRNGAAAYGAAHAGGRSGPSS